MTCPFLGENCHKGIKIIYYFGIDCFVALHMIPIVVSPNIYNIFSTFYVRLSFKTDEYFKIYAYFSLSIRKYDFIFTPIFMLAGTRFAKRRLDMLKLS